MDLDPYSFWSVDPDFIDLDPDPDTINPDPHHWFNEELHSKK